MEPPTQSRYHHGCCCSLPCQDLGGTDLKRAARPRRVAAKESEAFFRVKLCVLEKLSHPAHNHASQPKHLLKLWYRCTTQAHELSRDVKSVGETSVHTIRTTRCVKLHFGRTGPTHLPAPTPKDSLNSGGDRVKANAPVRPELSPGQVTPPNALNLIPAFYINGFHDEGRRVVQLGRCCNLTIPISYRLTTSFTHLYCRVVQLPVVLVTFFSWVGHHGWFVRRVVFVRVPRWLHRWAPRELYFGEDCSAFGMPGSANQVRPHPIEHIRKLKAKHIVISLTFWTPKQKA